MASLETELQAAATCARVTQCFLAVPEHGSSRVPQRCVPRSPMSPLGLWDHRPRSEGGRGHEDTLFPGRNKGPHQVAHTRETTFLSPRAGQGPQTFFLGKRNPELMNDPELHMSDLGLLAKTLAHPPRVIFSWPHLTGRGLLLRFPGSLGVMCSAAGCS